MSSSLSLHAHNRLVRTPFGLLGTDENALSFALGYTFQQCPRLLQWFLKYLGLSGVRQSSLQKARLALQGYGNGDSCQGITDIEIHLPGCFHVIVEAKVGMAVPSIDQCRKYLPRFDVTKEPFQRLVALVQSPDHSFVQEYGGQDPRLSRRLVGFNWPQLFPECVRLMLSETLPAHSKEWVRSFHNFLDHEFDMKAFTTEVWILAINTKPLWANGMSFWDIHQKYRLYWDRKHPTVRPLYLGFRVHGTVDAIYRVNRIEHSVPIIDRVPELANVTSDMPNEFRPAPLAPEPVGMKAEWPSWPFTIWHFDPAVKLPNPLTTGGGMYNRRVRCDLDLLLSCKSVQEIEQAMGKRRRQPGA